MRENNCNLGFIYCISFPNSILISWAGSVLASFSAHSLALCSFVRCVSFDSPLQHNFRRFFSRCVAEVATELFLHERLHSIVMFIGRGRKRETNKKKKMTKKNELQFSIFYRLLK